MSLSHVLKLFVNPAAGWAAIHDRRYSVAGVVLGHTLIFALIPAAAGYFGTTQVGWQVADGIITFVLGLLVLAQWPASGLWAIGLFVGIDLILFGLTWIMLALRLRTM